MTKQIRSAMQWRVIGKGVRGTAQEGAGKSGCEQVKWSPESGEGPPLVATVSSGIGLPRSFRTRLGAHFAVGVGNVVLADFFKHVDPHSPIEKIQAEAEKQLPREFLRLWREAVRWHYSNHPFTDAELRRLECAGGAAALEATLAKPLLAYDAMAMSTLAGGPYIACLQIGAGDLLLVSEAGETRRAFPGSDAPSADSDAASLCDEDAATNFRLLIEPAGSDAPSLVILCSPAFADSFERDAEFMHVGADMLKAISTEGLEKVSSLLERVLVDASRRTDGEDVALAVFSRSETSAQPAPKRRWWAFGR